jgi:hypothetical protein
LSRTSALIALAAACSAPSPTGTTEPKPPAAPTAEDGASADAGALKARLPKIVVVPEPPAKDTEECTAQRPEGAIFARDSPRYSHITVEPQHHLLHEIATLRGQKVRVMADVGGCVHFGARYSIEVVDMRDIDDLTHYAERGLDILETLDFAPKATTFVYDLSKWLRPLIESEKGVGECDIDDGNMTHVSCSAYRDAQSGTVVIQIVYDLVL